MQFPHHVRFGFRSLMKRPGLTLVALLTLALGIGANAAVFTLTNDILLKGYPFDKSDRILYLQMRNVRNDRFAGISYPDYRDWRTTCKSLEGIAAFTGDQINVGDDENLPEVYPAARMTTNSFRLIGQKPIMGRDFAPEDEVPGAPAVAILTYGLWERRYSKDPGILGRTVRMSGVPTTVIGVMPRDFAFPFNNDLWLAYVPTAVSEQRQARQFGAFGRLRDGVDLKTARAEMTAIAKSLERDYPATNQDFTVLVRTYSEQIVGPFLTTIFEAMMVAVSFVLLIACANVANLQLARATARAREISIRVALGASRRDIIQQLLLESVMLSLAGGVLGCGIAIWGTRAFDLAVTPMGKPRWVDLSMDARALTYLLVVSFATGILFGLAPALRLANLDVNTALKDTGRGSSVGVRGKRLANWLVIAEMALAVVLLTGAGLMVRSFLNVYRASLGINSSNVLTMRIVLPARTYPQPADQISVHDRLSARLNALPGVETEAIGNTLPTGGSRSLPYELEGATVDDQHRQTLAAVIISPDFFKVWQVKTLRGRFFAETDTASSIPVIMVNQAFATKHWPNQDPLTKRLRVFTGTVGGPWLQVVGLVSNIVHNGVASDNLDPVIYIPFRQNAISDVAIMLRTHVPPGSLGSAVRREIQAVDRDIAIYNLWTMEERLLRNYWFQGLIGTLFVIFAGIALLLSSVGLYAMMANSVSQRTQEMGVRIAVGSSAAGILRLVFAQGMRQMATGLVIGVAGALALTRVLTSVLTQVSASDPLTFLLAGLILSVAAALGCLIPARRAMAVDPVIALYHE
ncbi:MAG TPA: ABC transporter permease [Vicinamibacterales bacterium]|nr:ABC transporter permease [Vicinamibacterales bacterium]